MHKIHSCRQCTFDISDNYSIKYMYMYFLINIEKYRHAYPPLKIEKALVDIYLPSNQRLSYYFTWNTS